MSSFQFDGAQSDLGIQGINEPGGMAGTVLYENASWFARIRWVIIGILLLLGFAATVMPGVLRSIGLVPPTRWPWVLAGILTVTNVLFLLHLHQPANINSGTAARANIWMQIVSDMMVVTALIHLVGSTQSFFAFIYLFHIALACIFFSRQGSFRVTLLAASLFMACILAETAGFDPRDSILADVPHTTGCVPRLSFLLAVSAIVVWFVVWYLVSTLSQTVRQRDRQLAVTNAELVHAHEEKNQLMLRTTHDLKAPFAGIETNIQVLRALHWEEIPETIRAVIAKIEARSVTLRERIGDILKLGELRSDARQNAMRKHTNLVAVLEAAIRDISEKAADKQVQIHFDHEGDATVTSDGRQLLVLFRNLIANAVFYSGHGSPVEVTIESGESTCVRIVDHGIGISDDALPRIFDEYYRTKEAMRFNKMSTGLGLAIVKQVVCNLGLKVTVSSAVGEGTCFEVLIPEDGRESDGIDPGH